MELQTFNLGGRDYVIVLREEYDKLAGRKAKGIELPELPAADAHGNRPAVAAMRAVMVRGIINRMNALSLTQAELAKMAGLPRPTLNRILKCARTPDVATTDKIEKALAKQERIARKSLTSV